MPKPKIENFICKHEGCKNTKHAAKGYCYKHYEQFKKHGRTFIYTRWTFNEVVDCGNYYELILTDKKLREVGRAKIDKEDLDRVKFVSRWYLDSNGYVCSGKADIFMHRLITVAKEKEEVDHKNTGIKSRSDNRKKNLRICTHRENKYNTGTSKTNTSGFKGVHYHKPTSKWRADITHKGKRFYLGLFTTPKEASNAYNKAAIELQGEFAHKSLKSSP